LVNPFSQSGATGRRMRELEDLLRRHFLGDYRILSTEREGDGERLARHAIERGATRLVIAGGDGTASEAVSGLLRSGSSNGVEIALLPLGTGRDFARLLGLGTDLSASVARLESGRRRNIDAGRVRCRAPDGGERERFFLNIASIGLPAESTRWLQRRLSRRGPMSYVASALVGLARYKMPLTTILVDDRVAHEGPLALAAVSNGRSFAGGMRVAPEASIDDGVFDVVIAQGMSAASALWLFPRLMLGRHVGDRRVHVQRGKVVRAESEAAVWVEADGEPVGTLPCTIEILPGALTLCGLP